MHVEIPQKVKSKIKNSLLLSKNLPAKIHGNKPIYIDGKYYYSFFSADGISGLSYVSISKAMKESNGAPTKIKNHILVTEKWIKEHPELLK